MYHVVFLAHDPLDAILAGRKRRELRLSTRRAPVLLAQPGHCVLLKRSGGEIEAVATVGDVDRLDVAAGGSLAAFIARWWSGNPADTYLHSKPGARYGAAIELLDVRRVVFPAELTPRGVRMGWAAGFDVGGWGARAVA